MSDVRDGSTVEQPAGTASAGQHRHDSHGHACAPQGGFNMHCQSRALHQKCIASTCLQLVEEWEPLEYQRHTDVLEAALTAAVSDAMGSTRTAGRAAFAAYAANMPERANALLRRMDSGLQQKLTTAVAQYAAGSNLMAGEGW
jgi:hypothetical protein